MEARETIPHKDQAARSYIDLTGPRRPCEPIYDAKVDQALDERDALQREVQDLKAYTGCVPSEVLAQKAALSELHPRVAEAVRRVAVMRGDYLDGDPALRVEKKETQDEKAIRVLARIRELQASGVRGFRKVVSQETGWSRSYIRQLIDRAKKLEEASIPRHQSRRRA